MSLLEWKLHPNLRIAQLPRYNSLLYDPDMEAVDEMAQSWKGEPNYINSPFKTIPQILDKVME